MNDFWRTGVAVASLVLAGCTDMASMPPQDEPATATEAEYRIGVDDRVQVNVWRNPELSVTGPVRPDGKISVPLIGDVDAGGRTPTEVADAIKEQLSVYIR